MAAHTSLQIRVFYLSDAGIKQSLDPQFGTTFSWDVDLLSGYDHEFVPNRAAHPGTNHFAGLQNPTLFKTLSAWQPDAVLIFGYNYSTHLKFIFRATLHRLPLIFRGDSHLLGRTKIPFWKQWPLRLLYRQFAAIIYTGIANRAYYKSLGVSDQQLYFSPHSVDSQRFTKNAAISAAAHKAKAELGLDADTQVVLFAGKLVAAKQPLELLQAFLKLQAVNTALVFVGEGAAKPELQCIAAQSGSDNVHFLPFANQSDMPARYLMADIFVLPSRGYYETWGLAVNEAMHLGIPCLVSNRVGCQQDLVMEGETGWVFDIEAPDGLACALSRALQTDRQAMKPRILDHISHYTYREATNGLLSALAFTLEDTPATR